MRKTVTCDIIMNAKKIISLAASLCMVSTAAFAAVSSVSAAAPGSAVDIKVEDVKAKAGEKIQISINANIPEPGIAGAEFALKYDPDFLTVTAVKDGNISGSSSAASEELKAEAGLADTMVSGSEYSCLDYSIKDKDGIVDIMWATGIDDKSYWLKGSGQFIIVEATVNANAKGSSNVTIESIDRKDNAIKFGYVDYSAGKESMYAVNVENGTVTVGEDAPETSNPVVTEKPDESTSNGNNSSASKLGDVTCDGEIDIRDITLLNQYLVGMTKLSDEAYANANVIYSDDKVDVKDLGQLKKYIVKLITKF